MLSLIHRDRRVAGRPAKASGPEAGAAPGNPCKVEGISEIRGYFSGTYVNGVDGKNRLSVPSSLRETVEVRSSVKALVLSPAEHAPCLVGYDVSYFARIERRLEQEFAQDFGPGRGNKARQLFAMAEQLKYDDTGRIVLTPTLRDAGELGATAVFLGAGDYFELWAPDLLLARSDLDPRMLRSVQSLLAGRN